MTLLEQCRIWNENKEYKNVIVAIETLEEKYRSPDLDCELACAYNNIGDADHMQYFQKAAGLLLKHEKLLSDEYSFNFRLAYAYYFLDEKSQAFYHFKKAYDARPGDPMSGELMMECMRQLSFPVFENTYKDKVKAAGESFVRAEEDIEQMQKMEGEKELHSIFGEALTDINLEWTGKNEITFYTDWDKNKLFKLQYLCSKMPEEIRSIWSIHIGRPALSTDELRTLRVVDNKSGMEFSVEDFAYWIEDGDILIYSEKIIGLLDQEELAYNVTDEIMINIFGEISIMALEPKYSILRKPGKDKGRPLTDLISEWEGSGRKASVSPLEYLNTSVRYDRSPDMSSEPVIRSDVYVGTTACPGLINEYSKTNFGDEAEVVDSFAEDGIGIGYISYPLSFIKYKNNFVNEIRSFNTRLMKAVADVVGLEEVTFTGGATGTERGYIDLISWGSMVEVLGALIDFFGNDEMFDVQFQCFRSGFPPMDIFAEDNYV